MEILGKDANYRVSISYNQKDRCLNVWSSNSEGYSYYNIGSYVEDLSLIHI